MGSLHELLSKTEVPKIKDVARIPSRHPRDVTVVDEERIERRRKKNKGNKNSKITFDQRRF
jgi:hypothetical protein